MTDDLLLQRLKQHARDTPYWGEANMCNEAVARLMTVTQERDALKAEQIERVGFLKAVASVPLPQRAWDLLRYCRGHLMDEQLITAKEYAWLLNESQGDGSAVARLQAYDEILAEVTALRAQLAERERLLVEARALVNELDSLYNRDHVAHQMAHQIEKCFDELSDLLTPAVHASPPQKYSDGRDARCECQVYETCQYCRVPASERPETPRCEDRYSFFGGPAVRCDLSEGHDDNHKAEGPHATYQWSTPDQSNDERPETPKAGDKQ